MQHRKMRALLPKRAWVFLVCLVILPGCLEAGKGGTVVTGSSAGSTSVGADAALERCDAPLGTLAVDDGTRKPWVRSFRRATKIATVEPLIRLAVQQSNCFVITSIGNFRSNKRLSRITKIQRYSGEYRTGSKQHQGQRVAADYFLEPSIIINNAPTSKIGASLGRMFHPKIGELAGALENWNSVVTLTLTDIRSTVQVAAAEGSATSTSFDGSIAAFGGSVGGLSNTPAGKATVAGFVDAYNGLVQALKNYKAQGVKGGLGRGGTLKVK